MPNGTRKSQSTRHSNNVRNAKKEQAKRNAEAKERQKAREAYTQFGIIDDESNDANTRWAKRVSRDIFFAPRNKIVLCCEDNPRATQIVMKYIRKNGGNSDVVRGLKCYIDNKVYWCIKDEFMKWQEDIVPRCRSRNDEVGELAIYIIVGLLLCPPKCNGEKFNISCGFLGSIWIDATYEGVEYRIGLYNGKGKNYDIKDFNPVFAIDKLDTYGFTMRTTDSNGNPVEEEFRGAYGGGAKQQEKNFAEDLGRVAKVLEAALSKCDVKEITDELLKTHANSTPQQFQEGCAEFLKEIGYDENLAQKTAKAVVKKVYN